MDGRSILHRRGKDSADQDAAGKEETARIELEESFRALGFDPGALGTEKVPQKVRQSGGSSSCTSARSRTWTAGAEAQANISRRSAGCSSPYAHFTNRVASPCLPYSIVVRSRTAGSDTSGTCPGD